MGLLDQSYSLALDRSSTPIWECLIIAEVVTCSQYRQYPATGIMVIAVSTKRSNDQAINDTRAVHLTSEGVPVLTKEDTPAQEHTGAQLFLML